MFFLKKSPLGATTATGTPGPIRHFAGGFSPDNAHARARRTGSQAQTIWIVDAHGYGKRFIVRTDEILTAFIELESTFAARFAACEAKPCMKIRNLAR